MSREGEGLACLFFLLGVSLRKVLKALDWHELSLDIEDSLRRRGGPPAEHTSLSWPGEFQSGVSGKLVWAREIAQ